MPVNITPKSLQRPLPFIFLFALSFVIFAPVVDVASQIVVDFGSHIGMAEDLPHKIKHVSYVLYHATYRLLKHLFPSLHKTDIALLAIMVYILPLPMIIFSKLTSASAQTIPVYATLLLSLALTIAAPITIWANETMLGYFNSIVYHNPTLIALRLFVIPVSILALRVFSNPTYRDANHRIYTILLCASIVLLSTQAKPSYTIVLIPGCCLFAAWRMFRGYRVDWTLLVVGFCIPGTLMLGLQYIISYYNFSDGSSISFGIFVFFREWYPDWSVPILFLLSIAFPLAVYLLFFTEAKKHLYLNMSWAVFAVSALVTYSVYESGPRIHHGNFLWNSYIAVFVLMFASILFLVQQYKLSRLVCLEDCQKLPSLMSLKFSISLVLFGSHVLYGLGYFIRFLTGYVPLL